VGDRGKIENAACECGRELPLLTEFNGRCEDYITCPDGTLADPYLFEHVLKVVPSGHKCIEQFRIIQKAHDFILVKLLVQEEVKQTTLNRIKTEFGKRLGNQVQIDIECVSHLPRDKSGKLRCFISEIPKDGDTASP